MNPKILIYATQLEQYGKEDYNFKTQIAIYSCCNSHIFEKCQHQIRYPKPTNYYKLQQSISQSIRERLRARKYCSSALFTYLQFSLWASYSQQEGVVLRERNFKDSPLTNKHHKKDTSHQCQFNKYIMIRRNFPIRYIWVEKNILLSEI